MLKERVKARFRELGEMHSLNEAMRVMNREFQHLPPVVYNGTEYPGWQGVY